MATGKVDNSGTLADLDKFERVLPKAALKAMRSTAQFASLFVTKYLHGPRPMFLQSVSNTLRTHIGYTAELHGRDVYGYIGTNAKSKKGFNYPEYWEQGIENHNRRGLRKFLAPAIGHNQRAIGATFNQEFKKELTIAMKGGTK